MNSLEVVQRFIGHIFTGKMDEALALTTATTKYVSTRPTSDPEMPVYGTFVGPDGARKFFNYFAESLEPGEFSVEASFSEGDHVAMYGRLRHHSRKTGREFASDWAMICCVQDGYLTSYHFYEDTAALEAAVKP